MAETAAVAPAEEQVEIEFGLWWPAAEPSELHEAAAAWRAMATALESTARELADHAASVVGPNQGLAVDAFVDYLGRWSDEELPKAAESCRSIADAFTDYAEAVEEVRDQIKQMAIEIAATVAVGAGLALLTAGVSAGAAAGLTATMVARAGVLATSLAARVIAVCSRIAVFAGMGALEGGASNLLVQTGRNTVVNENHNPFEGYDAGELGWSVAGGTMAGGAFGGVRAVPIMRGLEPAVDSSRLPFGLAGTPRSGSALKLDAHHAFPNLVDNASSGATRSLIPRRGPGGVVRGQDELLQRAGSLNGRDGVFEWIVRDGKVVHRRFIPGGVVNGVPNQVPPKPTP